MLVNSGEDITYSKRIGSWKSTTVVAEDSTEFSENILNKILLILEGK